MEHREVITIMHGAQARKGRTIMPGAVGKEEQSGIERQEGQNYQAWRTREEEISCEEI